MFSFFISAENSIKKFRLSPSELPLPKTLAWRLKLLRKGLSALFPSPAENESTGSTSCIKNANFLLLIAALISRSWKVRQSGHFHSRSFKVNLELSKPQTLQVLKMVQTFLFSVQFFRTIQPYTPAWVRTCTMRNLKQPEQVCGFSSCL